MPQTERGGVRGGGLQGKEFQLEIEDRPGALMRFHFAMTKDVESHCELSIKEYRRAWLPWVK